MCVCVCVCVCVCEVVPQTPQPSVHQAHESEESDGGSELDDGDEDVDVSGGSDENNDAHDLETYDPTIVNPNINSSGCSGSASSPVVPVVASYDMG